MTVPKPIDTVAFDRITAGDLGRWAVAVVFIAAMGGAGAMTLQRWSPAVAAQPASEPVMLIDLAPLPAPKPQSIPEPPEIEQPVVEPRPVVPELTPDPPVVEPPAKEAVPPPVVEPEVVPSVEPVVPPEPVPEPEPPVEEPVVSDLLMPAMMSPELRRRRAETPPTPRDQRTQTPRKPVEQAPQKPRPQEAVAAAQPPAQAAAPSVSSEQWQSQVLRRLDQRKVYPRAARNRGETGAVVISFSVDAGGRVSAVSVARSSGIADLDQAAIETARRASPLPRPPAGFAGQSLSASIRFTLR